MCHEPKNTFLEALEKDSLFADTTIEDFKEQLKKYRVISFYEARGLPNFGIVSLDLGLPLAKLYRMAMIAHVHTRSLIRNLPF